MSQVFHIQFLFTINDVTMYLWIQNIYVHTFFGEGRGVSQ
jgi:hypothetical protein